MCRRDIYFWNVISLRSRIIRIPGFSSNLYRNIDFWWLLVIGTYRIYFFMYFKKMFVCYVVFFSFCVTINTIFYIFKTGAKKIAHRHLNKSCFIAYLFIFKYFLWQHFIKSVCFIAIKYFDNNLSGVPIGKCQDCMAKKMKAYKI